MRLMLATSNAGKVKELAAALEPLNLFTEVLAADPNIFDMNVDETGQTFLENAQLKAKHLLQQLPADSQDVVLADDSVLSVDALNGEPGIYSARYAGDHDDQANRVKVLEKMVQIPDEQRTAHFNNTLVLVQKQRTPLVVEGTVDGKIAIEAQGENGFSYDSVFIPNGYQATFGQLPATVKATTSHRAKALAQLIEQLPQWLRGEK